LKEKTLDAGHQPFIAQFWIPFGIIKKIILVKKMQKDGCCNPFIAIGEGVIFNYKIQ
jgi:hypothetical protein